MSSAAGEAAKMSTVVVKGQPFSSALRIEMSVKARRAADVLISAPTGASTAGGKSKTIRASLPKEGAAVECVLE